jgi:hypothetical protein
MIDVAAFHPRLGILADVNALPPIVRVERVQARKRNPLPRTPRPEIPGAQRVDADLEFLVLPEPQRRACAALSIKPVSATLLWWMPALGWTLLWTAHRHAYSDSPESAEDTTLEETAAGPEKGRAGRKALLCELRNYRLVRNDDAVGHAVAVKFEAQ